MRQKNPQWRLHTNRSLDFQLRDLKWGEPETQRKITDKDSSQPSLDEDRKKSMTHPPSFPFHSDISAEATSKPPEVWQNDFNGKKRDNEPQKMISPGDTYFFSFQKGEKSPCFKAHAPCSEREQLVWVMVLLLSSLLSLLLMLSETSGRRTHLPLPSQLKYHQKLMAPMNLLLMYATSMLISAHVFLNVSLFSQKSLPCLIRNLSWSDFPRVVLLLEGPDFGRDAPMVWSSWRE